MKRFSILLAGTALCALPIAAHAGNTPIASVCQTSDINLHIGAATYAPLKCKADVTSGANNPGAETTALIGAFPLDPLIADADLRFLAKDDGTSAVAPYYQGIKFTMDTPTGTTWTVGWTDTNGAASQNLPVTIDFAVLINGGNNGSAYYFNDVLLPEPPNNSGGGSFFISFFNGGNGNGGQNHPGLSHMLLTGTDIHAATTPPCTVNCGPPNDPPDDDPPPKAVPEPISLALLGTGILGLAAVRRRRS